MMVPFYLGVSYLRANAPKGTASVGPDQTFYGPDRNLSRLGGSDIRRDFIGVGGRWQATDDLYLGFTYQYLRHFEGAVYPGDIALKQNRYTLDLLGTYNFGGGWKALVDVYLHDRDSGNRSPLDSGPSLIGKRGHAGQGVESGHGPCSSNGCGTISAIRHSWPSTRTATRGRTMPETRFAMPGPIPESPTSSASASATTSTRKFISRAG